MPKRVVNPLPGQPRKVKEPWVEEYEKAFWRYLTVKATQEYGEAGVAPPPEEDDIWSWQNAQKTQSFRDHMKQCEVDRNETAMPSDEVWEEFGGTFTDNDRIHGLRAHVTCSCRKYRSVKVRYRGTLSELILGVLDAANDGTGEEDDS